LTTLSGLYLLLAALVSFGLGGYVAGRVGERWSTTARDDVVEIRDGMHGTLAWAIAVVITGLLAACWLQSKNSQMTFVILPRILTIGRQSARSTNARSFLWDDSC
jgi:MFS family permease